jgi:hypothetical protein
MSMVKVESSTIKEVSYENCILNTFKLLRFKKNIRMYVETFYVLVQSLTEKNIILVRKDKKNVS